MPRLTRRPASPDLKGYRRGDVVVQVIRPFQWEGEPIVSLVAIGAGRADGRLARPCRCAGTTQVRMVGEFPSVTSGLVDWPEAQLGGTETALLQQEQAIAEHQRAVQEWEGALKAAGEKPCDHCGGVGGRIGWPGWTCGECDGAGHVPVAGVTR